MSTRLSDRVAPGELLAGRYRVLSLLGRGAMGSVWRVRDEETSHELALKLIAGPVSGERDNRTRRFEQEAHAMQRLRSPNVVQVVANGSCRAPAGGELLYLAMELLDGESLRARLDRPPPLGAMTTLRVARDVARALSLAHARGIVHRDLKPANVQLVGRGDELTCKVLDFGLSKSLATRASLDVIHTTAGKPLGTPFYMSPEQTQGLRRVDHRADLWTLGVIVFECLCGQRPFEADSLAELFAVINDEPIVVPSQLASVPAGFDGWFARAVARDVQSRFQSARALYDELELVIDPISAAGPRTGVGDAGLSEAQHTRVQSRHEPRTTRRIGGGSQPALIGRSAEHAAIDRAISDHCRVITLRGARGMGVSSIARSYAATRSDELGAGVWSCQLSHAADGEAMWLRLALTFDIELRGDDRVRTLARALSCLGPALFVLEGADRVRAQLAEVLERIVPQTPHALFLVVSSRALGVPTERTIDVPPLTPDAAMELLEERANDAGAPRELLLRVADACRGNPLAIELSAGMLEHCTWAEIAHRLEQAVADVDDSDGDARTSHIARAAIAALSAPLAAALTQCACFRGSFDVAAAEAVVDLADVEPPVAIDDVLQTVTRARLLMHRDGGLALHTLVRRTCAERLQTGDGLGADGKHKARAALVRHGVLYALLGSEASLDALQHAGGHHWRRYLRDVDELTAAYERAIVRQDGPTAASCGLALAVVEARSGRADLASSRLVAALTLRELDDRLRLRAIIARGRALLDDRRIDKAVQALEEARQLAFDRGETRLLGVALQASSDALAAAGRAVDAGAVASEAYAVTRGLGDPVLHADSAALCARFADDALAVGYYEEARQLHGLAAAGRTAACDLTALAQLYGRLGDMKRARQVADEAIAVVRRLGERATEARVLGALGTLALDAGDSQRAAALLEDASGRSREIGARDLEARWLAALADVWTGWGWRERADQLYADAERCARDVERGRSLALVEVLWRRARDAARSGNADRAQLLADEIELLLQALPAPDKALSSAIAALKVLASNGA